MMRMLKLFSRPAGGLRPQLRRDFFLVVGAVFGLCLTQTPVRAQSDVGMGDAGACTLKDHVYTCNGAAFEKALAGAKTVRIETNNVDGVARLELTKLVTKKLGKTIVPAGSAADLVFLLMPVVNGGSVDYSSGTAYLGTLRVYSVAPDGSVGDLLWAELYSGTADLPWPIVVRGLILQFQARFHIK